MVFPDGGQQLFVGEGDFSLTRSLFEHHSLPKDAIISCFSEDLTEEAAENAKFLSSAGISVITGVDATSLEKHPDISRHTFDYIIFNFPHTGHKMKIQLCRTLLKNFFYSASSLLTAQGQVWVTLCAGQGGTAGEVAPRAWADSWQVTAQAAAAGLLLRRLEPFRPELYPGYRPTGNRGRQSRTFHTGRGVIHVLVRGAPLPLDRLADRLAAGGRALLLDGAPLPLAQYWLRRLPPADESLAALIVSRLTSASAAVRRRLLVRHEGRLFRAEDAVFESAGDGDVRCRSGADERAPDGVCVTYTAEDGEVAAGVEWAPLRTAVSVAGAPDVAPDARAALAAFGLACKQARQGDDVDLSVGCGGAAVRVASVLTERDGSAPRVVTTYHVDGIAACWAGSDDWRQAARLDFRANGAHLALDSVHHPPAYRLDMSFWLDGGAAVDEPFSWSRLRRALRAVLGEVLVSLCRLDEYTQPDSGRCACTVRLQYQDLSGPLSYEAARRLHVQVLPDILSRALGVQPR